MKPFLLISILYADHLDSSRIGNPSSGEELHMQLKMDKSFKGKLNLEISARVFWEIATF